MGLIAFLKEAGQKLFGKEVQAAERDEEAARHLTQRRRGGEEPGGPETELAEELAGRPEAMAPEPAEELLGAVRRDEEPDHHAGDQEAKIEEGRAG